VVEPRPRQHGLRLHLRAFRLRRVARQRHYQYQSGDRDSGRNLHWRCRWPDRLPNRLYSHSRQAKLPAPRADCDAGDQPGRKPGTPVVFRAAREIAAAAVRQLERRHPGRDRHLGQARRVGVGDRAAHRYPVVDAFEPARARNPRHDDEPARRLHRRHRRAPHRPLRDGAHRIARRSGRGAAGPDLLCRPLQRHHADDQGAEHCAGRRARQRTGRDHRRRDVGGERGADLDPARRPICADHAIPADHRRAAAASARHRRHSRQGARGSTPSPATTRNTARARSRPIRISRTR
jgi:hypothetical protein